MKIIKINENDANQRLDKLIQKLMPQLPKSLMYKGIRKNDVRINGKHCHDEKYILSEGDELTLYFPDEFYKEKKEIKKAPSPDIIYEDDNILVVNKPSGIPVHDDDKGTKDTLINRILYYLAEKNEYNAENENSFSPALCNRLDRNTSGLVIAAKNASSLRIINEKIKNREIKKYYIAVCEGIFEKKEDKITSYLVRGNKSVTLNQNNDGKEIITKYRVIDEENNKSTVEIELLTGRTHQIRAQMSQIGHPLYGDTKYGGEKSKNGYSLKSCKLVFDFSTDAGILNYITGLELKI